MKLHIVIKHCNETISHLYKMTLQLDNSLSETYGLYSLYDCNVKTVSDKIMRMFYRLREGRKGKVLFVVGCSGHLHIRVSAHTPSSAPQRG